MKGLTGYCAVAPGHPFLAALEESSLRPGVSAHSIVAVKGDGSIEAGNDGVVEYTSAHLDWAESELVVRSGHSTLGTPATINEVRRILYERIAVESPTEPSREPEGLQSR